MKTKKLNNQTNNKTVQSDIVQPVDEVKQREHWRKDDAWPAVNGIHIRQVWDFDFELRGSSPQAAAFYLGSSVQGVAAGGAGPNPTALLAVLDVRRGGAVQLHHGLRVPNICHTGGDLPSSYFVMDLQSGQEDVPVSMRLRLNG